ncbi:ABC transporter permease [Dactylosporangium sucinum]|uniref:Transport permease protein n=1 Tax=Dactylosporangium sucinum TaxID=1424081 RepID=A0A917UAC7_9ACTN|nr:ABC transporter permease [Dactylosporangium sucinum]GGM70969.1 transport permease protein [Dactylosporangium sucinum]
MTALWTVRHSLTMAWRNLTKLRHSPDQLIDVVTMPIVLVAVFVYLFGNAVSGSTHSYLQYVLPGIAVQTLMFTALGIGVGLSNDQRNGIFDRLRSLPIARSAPLIGYVVADVFRYVLSLVLVFALGLALGFRTHANPLAILAGCGIIVLFAFAVSWVMALFGLLVRDPAGVNAFSFLLILPLTFGSNVFVPVGKLPGWLQAWVKINPVSHVSDAARNLLLGLPVGHSVVTALLWSAVIVAVFGPLATWVYSRRV